MKYCPNCGNQLSDEALFCEYCGAKQPVVHQSEPQPMPQSMPDPAMVQSQISMGTELKTEKASKKKKGSKKPLIITLIIILVAALGVGGFFLIKHLTKSPQEKLLDEYFEAINERDFDALDNMVLGNDSNLSELDDRRVIIDRLAFYPGNFYWSDFLKLDKVVAEEYYKGLGYSGSSYEDLYDNYHEDMENGGKILLSKFNCSYELEDVKKAEDCDSIGYFKNGITFVEIDDAEEFIEDYLDIEVDDVYAVKLKIYWEYNGLPYGNDEKMYEIADDNGVFVPWVYDDVIDEMEDKDYYMLIYKSGDKWYMYNNSILKWSYSWRIEM